MKSNAYTPWGTAQEVTNHGKEGIAFFSTASHGGFYVPFTLVHTVPGLADFRPWAGRGWFEEDCDAQLVVACFPAAFTSEQVKFARRMVLEQMPYFMERGLPAAFFDRMTEAA